MPFPSKDIKDFCKEVINLTNVKDIKCFGDGNFCSCIFETAIGHAPPNDQGDLVNGLFWGIWTDQLMYYILIDGGIPELSKEPEFYHLFREKYPFPALYIHQTTNVAPPGWILSSDRKYMLPADDLLKSGRKEFLGEVENWLLSVNREDVRSALNNAIVEDLKVRIFPPSIGKLF